jgi:hypothetical protein
MADTVNNEPARELEEMEGQRDAVTFMLARMEQANDEPRPWSVVESLYAGEHPVAVFRDPRGMTCDDLAAAAGVEPCVIAAVESFEQEGESACCSPLPARCRSISMIWCHGRAMIGRRNRSQLPGIETLGFR